jgi:hypothetical protein
MNQTITLTEEKLQDIYTDKKFRNEVAYAHACYSAFPNSKFKYRQTCSSPVRWIVTEEQIELAKKELKRSQEETKERYVNSLLFVGMGMDRKVEGEVDNFRIRTELTNKVGRNFFVEFGMTADYASTRCDHSIDRDNDKNNYANLERGGSNRKGLCDYTPKAILNLVNKTFDCNFSEIFIDNHDLSTDDITCISPN